MSELLNDPLFGLGLSILAYYFTKRLFQWRSFIFFNPLIAAPVLILLLIVTTDVTYENYKVGGQIIANFLGPATVALGVPFYKKIALIKKNYKGIFAGAIVASIVTVLTTWSFGKLLGLPDRITLSMVAKSATGPIAIGVTDKLGGLVPVIILSTTITGIFGGIIGAEVLKIIGVKSKVNKGVTLGSTAHAGGTSRAFLLGQTEGAFSSIAMVVTGLVVAILAPVLITFLM